MNPFDLPGPQFLVFYAAFGVIVVGWLYLTKHASDADAAPTLPLSDPYAIGYLRGGSAEVVRLALAVLIDRQLLELRGVDEVESREGVSATHAGNEVERAILARCRRAQRVSDLVDDENLRQVATRAYEPGLERSGLIAGPDLRARRFRYLAGGIALLVIVAAIKIVIGLTRERPVSFLVASAMVFSVAAIIAVKGTRTGRGERVLRDLRSLFSTLRGRVDDLRPNASTNELAMVAAVFGLGTLPQATYPFMSALRPRPVDTSSSHSCGSSGGGSSCGGSSCGGGGGGCGGCGSS